MPNAAKSIIIYSRFFLNLEWNRYPLCELKSWSVRANDNFSEEGLMSSMSSVK